MRKKMQILYFFITISLFSCSNTEENQIETNPILNADFPVSEKLKFKLFNKYDIFKRGLCMVDGSILWYFKNNENNIGYCYDLKTGERLSTIASKGGATYELASVDNYGKSKIIDDSVQLHINYNTIKTFAKKDIVENKRMNEREFSVFMAHDSLKVKRMIKLPNGFVVATVSDKFANTPLQEKCVINDKSVFVFDDDEVKAYETVRYDSFDVKLVDSIISSEDVIKNAYASGQIEIKNNDMVVFSLYRQFILYTFDLDSGNVVKEKRYTNMKHGVSLISANDLNMEIVSMKSNDKYIYCFVRGYFNKKDIEAGVRTWKLFVFDWDLNPMKRFDLPDEKMHEYIISSDYKSVYLGKYTDEGLTLSKADLDI